MTTPRARRTKIIATLGPATDSEEMLAKLFEAGVNVCRLNMSHASHDHARQTTQRIRAVAERMNKVIGILMDTQGPAIRTGDVATDLNLKPGDKIALTVRGETNEEMRSVDVNYDGLVEDINTGDVVVVDNGNLKFRVLAKKHNQLECEVLTEGTLGSRRHINLPGIRVNLPALTDKDIADIELGIELEVDFIAMSFVRDAEDVSRLRAILDYRKAPQKIVAKLEDQSGVADLDDIIEAADAIMVARGDLGIEVPFEELPPLQRKIVKACRRHGRPVIVATHMLESMIENPSPTRAEVTDVANAVFEEADAIMLSGETSVGRYPVQCVQIMDQIARRIERSGGARFSDDVVPVGLHAQLVRSATRLAVNLDADGLVVFTRTGRMARHAAWDRPGRPDIFAFTYDRRLLYQLTLFWGLHPVLMDFIQDDPNETVRRASRQLLDSGLLTRGQQVVFVSEAHIKGKRVESIQVEEID
jgi:pyruvate kinase